MHRFLTDSSGTYTEYKAVSIGAGCEGATDMLKDLYKPVGVTNENDLFLGSHFGGGY